MLTLTDSEIKKYEEKKNGILYMIEKFPGDFMLRESILSKFTLKEILSKDFMETLLPKFRNLA